MTGLQDALGRLRASAPLAAAGLPDDDPVRVGMGAAGVRFVALDGPLEERWHQALRELAGCIRPVGGSAPVLTEGGAYPGTWLESTGTISLEVLGRFVPGVATASLLLYPQHQREDGLLPYKVVDDGPGFGQIQIVTPLARTVWNHHLLTGGDPAELRTLYDAMTRNDAWLAAHRDTRGSGGVEAFCTFDTGHDASPRFWFVPDRCPDGDPTRYDPRSPLLPYIAPDLTANVACQRHYLALIAAALGEDPLPWRERAAASLAALEQQCFDPDSGLYLDRAADGSLVDVVSDVLLRVLACEVGDDARFTAALERYLFNTRRFLSPYGFTSLAMDDPRFDHDYQRNSWGGPVNFLSLLRAPHAFEHHARFAELALTQPSLLAAVGVADRFPQCLDPWSGAPGYTLGYSPAILWFIDAIERSCGVLPRPDGTVWLTGLPPTRLDHGAAARATGYARTIRGEDVELVADDASVEVYRHGEPWLHFPTGWRVVVGPDLEVQAVLGLTAEQVAGDLVVDGRRLPLSLGPNQRADLTGFEVRLLPGPGFVRPRW